EGGSFGALPSGFDRAATQQAFAQAFDEYGMAVLALGPEEAARRMAAKSTRLALAAALDTWPRAYRMSRPKRDPRWKRLLALARAVDGDAWRERLRLALEEGDDKGLKHLAAKAPVARLRPSTLYLLGTALRDGGAWPEAVVLLKRAR